MYVFIQLQHSMIVCCQLMIRQLCVWMVDHLQLLMYKSLWSYAIATPLLPVIWLISEIYTSYITLH